jgi:AcrR family transcriptional regulator
MALESSTRVRILLAAVDLFSKVGYNAASTRNIARSAEVNEVTIYRYFPKKFDLFTAALEHELANIRVRADLLTQVAGAGDARSAMTAIFSVITDTARQQPALMRLLQFSALEFGAEMQPVYQRHFGELVEALRNILGHWNGDGNSKSISPHLSVLSFAASIILLQNLYSPLFGKDLSPETMDQMADQCASFWCAGLQSAALQSAGLQSEEGLVATTAATAD